MNEFFDPNDKNKLTLKQEEDLFDACAEAEYGVSSTSDVDMYDMEILD